MSIGFGALDIGTVAHLLTSIHPASQAVMTLHNPPADRLGLLKGHTRSVLCCKAVAAQNLLVTGGEVCSVPVTIQALCEVLLRFTASLAEKFCVVDRTVSCAHTTSDLKL